MNKRIYLLNIVFFILFLMLFSCHSYSDKLTAAHCKELTQILNSDQAIRLEMYEYKVNEYQDLVVLDTSMESMNKESRTRLLYASYRKNNRNIDSTIAKSGLKVSIPYFNTYVKKMDSLSAIMDSVDKRNQKKLIKFVINYGYPNRKRFKDSCKDISKIYVVFMHLIGNNTVNRLVEREYKAGRCPETDYYWIAKRRRDMKKDKTTKNN